MVANPAFGISTSTSARTAPPMLTRVLTLDAVACLALGLLLTLPAGSLAAPLGASTTFLRVVGLVLVGCSVAIWAISRRPAPALVALVVVLNLAWTAASVGVVAGVGPELSDLGTLVDLAQAAFTAGIAVVECLLLRRWTRPDGAVHGRG